MESFVLLQMPMCVIYMCLTFITPSVLGRFYRRKLKKEMVVLEKPLSITSFINDEENRCRFNGQRNERWIYMDLHMTCFIDN